MFDLPYNTRLVLLGVALLGGASGVIGTYAVLRRRSLLGDALAHATLPGLCLAYLIVGERTLPVLLTGAALSGLAGIACVSGLRRYSRIKEDAAIAIVLSVFFGLGGVLLGFISRIPGGQKAGLDSFILGRAAGMGEDDLRLIAGLAVATLIVVFLLYKELQLVSFDPAFATVQGWPAWGLDFLLQLLLVVAVIIGLPAVGVVLMAALLIVPGAAARFWTHRLWPMLILAGVIGMLSGAGGALASARVDNLPTGPSIILVAAAIFSLSLALGTQRGLLTRWLQHLRTRRELE